MLTKKPRVNIIVEQPLYMAMQDLANREGVSMSTIARDLIREAIELREEVALPGGALLLCNPHNDTHRIKN
jgi:hypothetical protein